MVTERVRWSHTGQYLEELKFFVGEGKIEGEKEGKRKTEDTEDKLRN